MRKKSTLRRNEIQRIRCALDRITLYGKKKIMYEPLQKLDTSKRSPKKIFFF